MGECNRYDGARLRTRTSSYYPWIPAFAGMTNGKDPLCSQAERDPFPADLV
jgi:hypothetical protein